MKTEILKIIELMGMNEEFFEYVESIDLVHDYENPFSEESLVLKLMDLSDEEYLKIALIELLTLSSMYHGLGISESILFDTLTDLKFRVERYYDRNSTFGLTSHDMKWLGYIYRGETFKIHNLKFRKYHLTYKEIERSGSDYLPLDSSVKKVFYEGLPVVYVHISAGADLSKDSVTESFRLADLFFSKHFSDYHFDYYICRTWMLYPGLLEFMGENSNILRFQNKFEIIGTHDNPEQTLSRVYGTVDYKDIELMQKTSSLMRDAYVNIDHLGVGVGVIKRSDL